MSTTNRSTSTFARRTDAKSKWNNSDTAKASSIRTLQQFTIKFEYGAMLLSAVDAGDIEETTRLLREGADVNYSNVDGLTCLHIACIDENFPLVKLLVDRGASIDACDNEGWTPLHAAASSRSLEIIKFLVGKGANLVAVNSESELPIDLTEVPAIESFLAEEAAKKGLDAEDARDSEERHMLEDALKWKKEGKIKDIVDPQGATPLHVAAAKGYLKVAKILLSIGADPNAVDFDGWTPLHAAVNWKQEDLCKELVANGAKLNALSYSGSTPFDLAADYETKLLLKELSIQYRANMTSTSTELRNKTPPIKSHRQVVGILKTSKHIDEDKKSQIPKPILPPTTKIPKPFVESVNKSVSLPPSSKTSIKPPSATQKASTTIAATPLSTKSDSKKISLPPTKIETPKINLPNKIETPKISLPTNKTETQKSSTLSSPSSTIARPSTVPLSPQKSTGTSVSSSPNKTDEVSLSPSGVSEQRTVLTKDEQIAQLVLERQQHIKELKEKDEIIKELLKKIELLEEQKNSFETPY